MKSIFIIITAIIFCAIACKKKAAHPPEYYYIQGTWNMVGFYVNGVDSTQAQKSKPHFVNYTISEKLVGCCKDYENKLVLNNLYSIYDGGFDGLTIHEMNFNIDSSSLKNSFLTLHWKVNQLTNSVLEIETTYRGKTFKSVHNKK